MYNHQLDTFLTVAEQGSFAKAAEILYISTPAVLQQINLLEERCGFALFVRSNRGVKLTPSGQSLAADARALIRLSEDALARAARMAQGEDHTVRVGTALLYKCRMLPDIWTRISEKHPDLKVELLPMGENASRGDVFSDLGKRYDLWEGIYADLAWDGLCRFLPLMETPVCCAVARGHVLAGKEELTLADLDGQTIVMPIAGVSSVLDHLRAQILQEAPNAVFNDSRHYGVDTFTLCEMAPYVLITQQIFADIHTQLKTLPLRDAPSLPYGLIYANRPNAVTRQFIEAAAAGLSSTTAPFL